VRFHYTHGRSQAWGWGGGKNVAAPNEMNLISPLVLALMFFAFYGLAADRQEYCFTKDFFLFIYFIFFKVYF